MSENRTTLGQLLRSIRARNQWTLREMSARSGIPFSTLSKVENDRLTLSYDKLQQLAQRLNIRVSELFAETEGDGVPAAGRRSLGKLEDAIRVNTPNYDYYYLCPELRRKRMVPMMVRIRAKSLQAFGDLVRHSGEEYLFVLEGRLAVHTEFYDPVVLESGQSIYIDSSMGHAYLAADGCEEATIVAVCSSAEEDQMHSLLQLHGDEAPEIGARPVAT